MSTKKFGLATDCWILCSLYIVSVFHIFSLIMLDTLIEIWIPPHDTCFFLTFFEVLVCLLCLFPHLLCVVCVLLLSASVFPFSQSLPSHPSTLPSSHPHLNPLSLILPGLLSQLHTPVSG